MRIFAKATKILHVPKLPRFILTTEKLYRNVAQAFPLNLVAARDIVYGMPIPRLQFVPQKALSSRNEGLLRICFVNGGLIYYGIKNFYIKRFIVSDDAIVVENSRINVGCEGRRQGTPAS